MALKDTAWLCQQLFCMIIYKKIIFNSLWILFDQAIPCIRHSFTIQTKRTGNSLSRLYEKSTAECSNSTPLSRGWRLCFTRVCWTCCPGNRVWFHYGTDKHNQRGYPPSIAREKTPAMTDIISHIITAMCLCLCVSLCVFGGTSLSLYRDTRSLKILHLSRKCLKLHFFFREKW